MIEVRLFATLRQGRQKIYQLEPAGFSKAADIIAHFEIPLEEVSILLINGFHKKPEDPVQDGDIISLFPPVGGG